MSKVKRRHRFYKNRKPKTRTKQIMTKSSEFQSLLQLTHLCSRSVKQRIAVIKQPRGGYINIKNFECVDVSTKDNWRLSKSENIASWLIGTTVDYLTRFMSGTPVEKAFKTSIKGAACVGKDSLCNKLLSTMNRSLSDYAITSAIKLATFDPVSRVGLLAYEPAEGISPDLPTITKYTHYGFTVSRISKSIWTKSLRRPNI